jgi:DNA-binding NtrC family response regulator
MSAARTRQATVPAEDTQGKQAVSELAVIWIFPTPCDLVTLLDTRCLVFGRDNDADVRLEGKETSRQHAEIRREGPLSILRDLGSLNGSFVNGVRITQSPLAAGDLIRLGEWIGKIAEVPVGSESLARSYTSFAPGLFAGPTLAPALDTARRIAAGDLPVIVEGETGTGKEGLCRVLHTWSGRTGPFVAVNCGALPEALAEAELFGYRKGVFTGAQKGQSGHFRTAHRGTLLLDEIVDLPLNLQVKLLRAIEQHEVVPLGESIAVPIDVRILATTQAPLLESVREGRFRADLFARLEGLILRLPPLRERVIDIPFLASRLLGQHAGVGDPPALDPRLVERLCLYEWPFNVRELDLLVRQLLALYPGVSLLKRNCLPERLRAATLTPKKIPTAASMPEASPSAPRTAAEKRARDKSDLAALIAALKATSGNAARAAAQVGLTRQRAYRLMEQRTYDELAEIRATATTEEDDRESASERPA